MMNQQNQDRLNDIESRLNNLEARFVVNQPQAVAPVARDDQAQPEEINSMFIVRKLKKDGGEGVVITGFSRFNGWIGFGLWPNSEFFSEAEKLRVSDQFLLRGERIMDINDDIRKTTVLYLKKVSKNISPLRVSSPPNNPPDSEFSFLN